MIIFYRYNFSHRADKKDIRLFRGFNRASLPAKGNRITQQYRLW